MMDLVVGGKRGLGDGVVYHWLSSGEPRDQKANGERDVGFYVGEEPAWCGCSCRSHLRVVWCLVTLGRSSDWDRQERSAPSVLPRDWESFKNTVHGRHGRGESVIS